MSYKLTKIEQIKHIIRTRCRVSEVKLENIASKIYGLDKPSKEMLLSNEEIQTALNKYPVQSHEDRWAISDEALAYMVELIATKAKICYENKYEPL